MGAKGKLTIKLRSIFSVLYHKIKKILNIHTTFKISEWIKKSPSLQLRSKVFIMFPLTGN